MKIEVSDEVGSQLKRLAEERKLTLDELVGAMLKENDVAPNGGATLADLARAALEANLATPERVDTAEQSREILNSEYADYLKRRRTSCP